MNGARQLLSIFRDSDIILMRECGKDNKVYSDAVYRLLLDKRAMSMFLQGDRVLRFRNHKRNAKGKLIEVEAYVDEQEI